MRAVLLVTVAGGLLENVLEELCPAALFVSERECDFTDFCQVRALFKRAKPKHILHLAAREGGIKENTLKSAELLSVNIQINTNILTAAHEANVSRLISVLSSCAFQFYSDRPSNEKDLHVGMPFERNLGYGYAKRMLDIQTKLLHQQYGCRYSTITPVTLYGPNDNWDLEQGHVVGSLIHKCCLAKQEDRTLEIWGSGKAVRQFVYSGDVASVLLSELESFHGPETLIVAPPNQGVTVRALAELIAAAVDFKGPFLFNRGEPEGQLIKVIQSKKFSQRYPDFEFISLEEGLQQTVAWFLEHHKEREIIRVR